MPRYIDADALKHELCIRQHMLNADSLWKTLEIMDAQPTADVVEGVRCLLCEHLDPTSPSGTAEPTFYFCKRRKIYVDPYDCCAFGDRRKEKTDER